MNLKSIPIFALAALLLAACGGRDEPATGYLSLAVTDAPVDQASRVVVEFTGVEVKPSGGEAISFDFATPRRIDLLALQGGGSETILDGVLVPAGAYNWARLKVNAQEDAILDSFIELTTGGQHELEVPSGAETGLKLVSGFVVPAGGAADYTIDFDLRKSVHEPMDAADSYKLRPTLRIVDNAQVGLIAGTVAAALIPDGCTPAVYVFTGAGMTPDDVDGVALEPVTTATVAMNTGTGAYQYRAAFLTAGNYTAAFTCGAAADDPATDNALTFAPVHNASVIAGQTTTLDFAAPAP